MSEYTAEDFAEATFARAADGGKAVRLGGTFTDAYWQVGMYGKFTDEDMARGGWVPVVEATEVMQHRQVDAEAHLEQIERLSKRAVEAEADAERARGLRTRALNELDDARATITDLRQENDRLERILQAPLSMKDLRVAWENAEVPTEDAPMRQGDVYISTVERDDRGRGYLVAAAGTRGTHMHFNARILSRAPREPWQDLADVLLSEKAFYHRQDADMAAKALHAAGVRVVGGEEA